MTKINLTIIFFSKLQNILQILESNILLFVKVIQLFCIRTSKYMLAHAFVWLKRMKNTWKSNKKTIFPSCVWDAHKVTWGKMNFLCLGVTPNLGWYPKAGCSWRIWFKFNLLCRPQSPFFYQGESTIFEKGNFLFQTPDTKNL